MADTAFVSRITPALRIDPRELFVDNPLDLRHFFLIALTEYRPPAHLFFLSAALASPASFSRTASKKNALIVCPRKRSAGLDLAIEAVRHVDGRLHTITIKPYLWFVKFAREPMSARIRPQ